MYDDDCNQNNIDNNNAAVAEEMVPTLDIQGGTWRLWYNNNESSVLVLHVYCYSRIFILILRCDSLKIHDDFNPKVSKYTPFQFQNTFWSESPDDSSSVQNKFWSETNSGQQIHLKLPNNDPFSGPRQIPVQNRLIQVAVQV